MKAIRQTYEMKATPEQVFAALTAPDVIQKWSGGPATMDDKVGTKFSMFGGQIHGSNLEVAANKKLVQAWLDGDWTEPSTVTFTLTPSAGGTTVELLHEGVPDDAYESINSGWNTAYLGQMQKMFAG